MTQAHKGLFRLSSETTGKTPESQMLDEEYTSNCPFCMEEIKSPTAVMRHIGDHQMQLALWTSRFYYTNGDSDDDSLGEDDEVVTAVDAVVLPKSSAGGTKSPDSSQQQDHNPSPLTDVMLTRLHPHMLKPSTYSYLMKFWFLTKSPISPRDDLQLGSLISSPLNPGEVLVRPTSKIHGFEIVRGSTIIKSHTSDEVVYSASSPTRLLWLIEKDTTAYRYLSCDRVREIFFYPSTAYVKALINKLPGGLKRLEFRKVYVVSGLMVGERVKFEETGEMKPSSNAKIRLMKEWASLQPSSMYRSPFEVAGHFGEAIIAFRLHEVRARMLGGFKVHSYMKGD